MNPLLRSLFRLVFLVWLVAVLICGAVIAQKIDVPMYGANLLTFLFTRKMPFSFEAPPQPAPVQPVQEEAEPAPPPPPAPVPALPLRSAVPSGPKQGKGSLSRPVFTVLPNGAVEIRVAYRGTLGEKRSLHPSNVASFSLDLLGTWSDLSGEFTAPDGSVIKKLQVGRHTDRVRFSALASDPAKPTKLRGEMYQEAGAVILVFTDAQPPVPPAPATTPTQEAPAAPASLATPVGAVAP